MRHRRLGCALALPLLLLLLAERAAAQGLEANPKSRLGANKAYEKLHAIYRSSAAWVRAYKQAPTACSRQRGNLCAAYGASVDEKAQMLVATSPQVFDARRATDMGGFSAVGAVKDQGSCAACVAFTVLGAAQSAMASALRQDARSDLSEQDFLFCKSLSPGEERSCSNSWTMRDGLAAFISMTQAGRYPVSESCLPYSPGQGGAAACQYDCQEVPEGIKSGSFKFVQLESLWEVQEHIRNHGSVVTRLDVYDDFKPFFKASPQGIYPKPGPGAAFVESHAIQVIGYDLGAQAWLCKNSWGPDFAAGGVFAVAFNSGVGVGNPDDTFGLKFVPSSPPPRPTHRLSASKRRPGCADYRAAPSDYVSRVARTFDLQPSQVLYENRDIIQDPAQMLTGMTLVLCGLEVPQHQATPAAEEQPAAEAPEAAVSAREEEPAVPREPTEPTAPAEPVAPALGLKAGVYGPTDVRFCGYPGRAQLLVQLLPGKAQANVAVDATITNSFASCEGGFSTTCRPIKGSSHLCGSMEAWSCTNFQDIVVNCNVPISIADRIREQIREVQLCYSPASGGSLIVPAEPGNSCSMSGAIPYNPNAKESRAAAAATAKAATQPARLQLKEGRYGPAKVNHKCSAGMPTVEQWHFSAVDAKARTAWLYVKSTWAAWVECTGEFQWACQLDASMCADGREGWRCTLAKVLANDCPTTKEKAPTKPWQGYCFDAKTNVVELEQEPLRNGTVCRGDSSLRWSGAS